MKSQTDRRFRVEHAIRRHNPYNFTNSVCDVIDIKTHKRLVNETKPVNKQRAPKQGAVN